MSAAEDNFGLTPQRVSSAAVKRHFGAVTPARNITGELVTMGDNVFDELWKESCTTFPTELSFPAPSDLTPLDSSPSLSTSSNAVQCRASRRTRSMPLVGTGAMQRLRRPIAQALSMVLDALEYGPVARLRSWVARSVVAVEDYEASMGKE